jgi:hypothetical protein
MTPGATKNASRLHGWTLSDGPSIVDPFVLSTEYSCWQARQSHEVELPDGGVERAALE